MAKKSIAQTVNLQGTPQAPAYKVAAQQVDTFVKGRSAEQILAQDSRMKVAANIDAIVETGAAAQKMMYEKQVAALDTTAAQIQADLDSGVISRIEESGDYSRLPETLRIRIGQTIGENDALKAYEEVRAMLAQDPSIALDPEKFNAVLGGYMPDVNGQDGYSIHRQSSQRTKWGQLSSQLRGEAQGIASAENKKTLVTNHRIALTDFLKQNHTKITAAEIHQGLASIASAGVMPSDVRTNVYEVLKAHAISSRDVTLLNTDFLPETIRDPALEYLIKDLNTTIQNENRANAKFNEWERETKRDKFITDSDLAISKSILDGQPIDEEALLQTAFVEGNAALTQQRETIIKQLILTAKNGQLMPIAESSATLTKLEQQLENTIGFQDNLVLEDGTVVKPTLESVLGYIATVPMNPDHKQELNRKARKIIIGGDITQQTSYKESMDIVDSLIDPKRLVSKTGKVTKEDADVVAKDLQEQMRREFRELFRDRLTDDGVISQDDRDYIYGRMQELANRKLNAWAQQNGVDFEINDPTQVSEDTEEDALNSTMAELGFEDKVEETPEPEVEVEPEVEETVEQYRARKAEEASAKRYEINLSRIDDEIRDFNTILSTYQKASKYGKDGSKLQGIRLKDLKKLKAKIEKQMAKDNPDGFIPEGAADLYVSFLETLNNLEIDLE